MWFAVGCLDYRIHTFKNIFYIHYFYLKLKTIINFFYLKQIIERQDYINYTEYLNKFHPQIKNFKIQKCPYLEFKSLSCKK